MREHGHAEHQVHPKAAERRAAMDVPVDTCQPSTGESCPEEERKAVREKALGVTLMRRFSCWCNACMRSWAPGEGTMDSNYICADCESSELPWVETSIARTDAVGISNAKHRALQRARELTKQLQNHFFKEQSTTLGCGTESRRG